MSTPLREIEYDDVLNIPLGTSGENLQVVAATLDDDTRIYFRNEPIRLWRKWSRLAPFAATWPTIETKDGQKHVIRLAISPFNTLPTISINGIPVVKPSKKAGSIFCLVLALYSV
jgi:hypothetical protein